MAGAAKKPGHRELVKAMRAGLDAGALAGPAGPVRDVVDAGTELGLAQATAAVEAGRPLRWQERREVRREVLAQQSSLQAAGQPQRRRMTVRDKLEGMSREARARVEEAVWFQALSERAQLHVLRLRDDVDEIEDEADYLNAREAEERALENIDFGDDEDVEWRAGADEAIALGAESGWSDGLTEAERRAAADIAAASAGPVYLGDAEEVFRDDLEDGWGIEGEEEE